LGIKSIWAKEPIGKWFFDEVKKLEI
jgi:hypothetical protein